VSRRCARSQAVVATLAAYVMGAIIALVLGVPLHAAAHPELLRADPPPDGLLAAPPRRIDLWLTEPVDVGGGSPAVQLLDEAGNQLPVENVTLDPADASHVRAEVVGIGIGTYTVAWSARSTVDGHTLSGTFAFRVGAGRAPGAATVEGESPPAWAVATRWLTFLGTALAAGGFFFARIIGPAHIHAVTRRRIAVALGAVVALVATLAEGPLQVISPPQGAVAPDLAEAIGGLPSAWWLRPVGLVGIIALSIVTLSGGRQRPVRPALEWTGLALSLVALLGLSLTSHAAARESWRGLALTSNVLHQWAVALWAGGLTQLALIWTIRTRLIEPKDVALVPALDPVRRFSRLALGLVAIGIATGAINAGFALPTLRSLWSSLYGEVLLLKVAVLVLPLALAAFNRSALRRPIMLAAGILRKTVRVEAMLVLLVVLGGSVLALLAPPVVRTAKPLDLAVPAETGDLLVHLGIQPARPGENKLTVALTDTDNAPLPLPPEESLIQLTSTSLNHGVETDTIELQPTGAGDYAVEGAQLSLDGWWRVNVTVRRSGQPDIVTPFYLRLPDPNLNPDRLGIPDSSEAAAAVFRRGLETLTSLRSVRYERVLGGGTGLVFVSEEAITTGGPNQPPGYTLSSEGLDLIRIGDREWLRSGNEEWRERAARPFYSPAAWGEEFEGATGFRLGITEDVNGEPSQVVTFFVPEAPGRSAAWYAWWIGMDSGRVHRQAMISRWHYMTNDYRDFNQPVTVQPPPLGTAPGSPAAAPAGT
jgi:copper transport protein